ncbi:hypothetical protein TOPH_01927 [Tolypocladium ophioglossoides CBS 100239]|uniref:FAD-binding domain-containing protein n=1 Tax=Tolypocladium ophioglossoides (strain CBS 100239) TaxID=1163406 RepID=A0A0L0NIH2_TOLOC|nr:hypothetical protein TOPH_01927 [Tolypocladium ophioglossoides CBS 100239]
MDAHNEPRHFLQGKTIFVAGGGVAGSAFVAGLRKLWDPAQKPPTVVVYDRDPRDVTHQRDAESYSLSISGYNEAGGLVALQKLGLVDDVFAHAISGLDGSGCFKIWGPDWRERLCMRRKPLHGLPTGSIRISRQHLRRVLNDVVEAWDRSRMQWESQCVSVRRLEDTGRMRVQIRKGAVGEAELMEEDCDLLVAADGANSKLRAWLRPQDKLQYTGAVLRGGLSRFDGGIPRPLGQDWGFIMSNTDVSCFVSPVDKNTVLWAVGHLERDPVPELDRSSDEDVQAVIARGRELGSHFQEPFQTIASRTDPKTVMCISARDKPSFSHDDPAAIPVVFIGDSNHALSPFAGFGANLALSDGWDLAEQLCRGSSLVEAVAAYDQISEPRARKILEGSHKSLRAGHSTGWRYWVFWAMLWVGQWISWLLAK